MLNPEKNIHEHVTHLSTSPVRCRFWQSYSKIKRWTLFGTPNTVYIYTAFHKKGDTILMVISLSNLVIVLKSAFVERVLSSESSWQEEIRSLQFQTENLLSVAQELRTVLQRSEFVNRSFIGVFTYLRGIGATPPHMGPVGRVTKVGFYFEIMGTKCIWSP